MRNLGIRNGGLARDLRGKPAESCAKNHSRFRNPKPSRANERGRFVNLFGESEHHVTFTDSITVPSAVGSNRISNRY